MDLDNDFHTTHKKDDNLKIKNLSYHAGFCALLSHFFLLKLFNIKLNTEFRNVNIIKIHLKLQIFLLLDYWNIFLLLDYWNIFLLLDYWIIFRWKITFVTFSGSQYNISFLFLLIVH